MLRKRQKLITIVCIMIGTIVSAIAYASEIHSIAYPIISRIWNLFIRVTFMAGILVMTASIIQLIQAFKDEDAEAKSKAIRYIAVGVALLSFQLLLDPILGALGFFR